MSQQTDEKAGNLPDPAEMAKTYAEVAQRASRLISQYVEKKAKAGVSADMSPRRNDTRASPAPAAALWVVGSRRCMLGSLAVSTKS